MVYFMLLSILMNLSQLLTCNKPYYPNFTQGGEEIKTHPIADVEFSYICSIDRYADHTAILPVYPICMWCRMHVVCIS